MNLPFVIFALIPVLAWAGTESKHVFHRHFEADDQVACAVAIRRILKPFRVENTETYLVGETAPGTGDFAGIESRGAEKTELPAIVSNPLMQKRRPDGPDDFVPNCYGAALGWFGIHNQWFNFDYEQFENLLKEHFVKVRRGTFVRAQALVVWRYADNKTPVHAAIYFPDHFIWHRPGSKPAVFTTFEKAVNSYGGRYGGPRDALVEFYKLKLDVPL